MGAASTPGMVALSDFNALYERVNRLQAQLDRDNEVDEIPFGDSVRTESKSPQSLLEKVGPCFQGKVKKVVIQSSQKTKFKYFFDFSDTSGWWSKPEARDTYHPQSAVRDTYGYFSVLNAPTIHRNWKFSTLPEESIEQEDENGQPKERNSAPSMDPLHKPPVPIECLEKDFESFFKADPLAVYKTHVTGGG